MRRSTPAQKRATSFLREFVSRLEETGESRLPTVRELAARAGVSVVTMSRCVGRFKDAGQLHVRHGRGIHIRSTATVVQAPSERTRERKRRWQLLREELQRELLSADYVPGASLPSLKELCATHDVCYRTLDRALQSLAGEGLLVRHKRSYRVPTSTVPKSSGTVVLIARSHPSGREVPLLTPRAMEHFHALQNECTRLGLNLRVSAYEYRSGLRVAVGSQSVLELAKKETILGTVVFPIGIGTSLVRLVKQVSTLKRPIAVINETGKVNLPQENACKALIQIYTLSFSSQSGDKVGRYLIGLGHRKVAYVSAFHRNSWSRNRLNGLERAFRAAGLDNAVVPFVSDRDRADPRVRARAQERLQSSLESGLDIPEYSSDVRERLFRSLRDQVDVTAERDAHRQALLPLLGRAIGEPGVTAWVAANDATAFECLDFLRGRNRRVPRDMSVVGFDDGASAFFFGLTSYNFNSAGLARAMLNHILGRTGRERSGDAVEIEGFVTERSTTAKRRT